jgi:aminopeptidase
LARRELTEFEQERFLLAIGRLRELTDLEDGLVYEPEFFRHMARFLVRCEETRETVANGRDRGWTLERLQERNEMFYGELLPGRYEVCYGNPTYARQRFGLAGEAMSMLYSELRGAIVYAFEDRPFDLLIVAELFLMCYSLFQEAAESEEKPALPPVSELRSMLGWYCLDYCRDLTEQRVCETLNPSCGMIKERILNEDLNDLRYLYRFGEYVTENELILARFLSTLPQEKIDEIARTWVRGYCTGFFVEKKDLSKKETVNLRCRLGFERITRAAILQFQSIGLDSIVYRSATHLVDRVTGIRTGWYGAIPNCQYEYEHRNDCAIWLDDRFVTQLLTSRRMAYEKEKERAAVHGGPAVMEVFGETPFTPKANEDALRLSPEQEKLAARLRVESARLVDRYISSEERSFTIIAYPVPEIGDQFEEIFYETARINQLDSGLYQKIQQKLIDALDLGTSVHVTGKNGNETDITVRLHPLDDPARQTNFENCVADVNIPVGEVFTSPVLKGTNGLLHVRRVFLNEYGYRDLKFTVRDGMVVDYSCANFDDEAKNRAFIEENILFHHKTLPIGEFAIGTNTTAYRMARQFGIEDKLPILIAEKTGPHFAFGDTCYSLQEDLAVFNPDGKEIIARDNECSIKRLTEPSEAYFGCHTDVTIPYDELGDITVLLPDGGSTSLIRSGRFSLPGTEELNAPLNFTSKDNPCMMKSD